MLRENRKRNFVSQRSWNVACAWILLPAPFPPISASLLELMYLVSQTDTHAQSTYIYLTKCVYFVIFSFLLFLHQLSSEHFMRTERLESNPFEILYRFEIGAA